MKKLGFLGVLALFIASNAALAIECHELGGQAELSISVNVKKLKATLTSGEEVSSVKLKRESAGGSDVYSFKKDGRKFLFTILNEDVAPNDKRNLSILTDLESLDKIFLGCKR